MQTRSAVAETAAAQPHSAAVHFESRLAFETDCSDVAADISAGIGGFTVIDCRSREAYVAGHVPGAIHLPHRRITSEALAGIPGDDLLVTYCNGPHCNASTRGALRLARLGRRVKEMPGGMTGWRAENLPIETGDPATSETG